MALTAKQEAFAVAVAKGATASDAYREAYDADGMKAEVIWVKASELAAHGKVSVRIKELQAPGLAEHQASVDRSMLEMVKGGYAQPADPITWSDKLRALDMLAKVQGLYKEDNKQRAPNLAIQVVYK